MAGDLVPIKLPPGMFRNGTEYESSGRWYDGNLVRWENGRLKPMGGWQALLAPGVAFTGVARGGIAFEDDNGYPYVAIGTNTNLYIGEGGVFTDVTPSGLVTGNADSILGAGYGAGPYGDDNYGTQRAIASLALTAATWSMDTFGDTIVTCLSSDQNIYSFDPTTGDVTIPSGSPTAAAVMATNEDYIVAIGAAGDPRLVQWPDIGTTTVWTPSDTNSAGSINLKTAGKAIAGACVGLQNLVWTDTDAHLLNFVGSPGIYGPIRIGTHCGLVGPRAYAVTDVAWWMGVGGFFMFNGVVNPIPCDVQDYIWRLVNWTQSAKIYAATNTRYNEVIWFFPSIYSTDGYGECDSYVAFNYKDGLWYFGIQSTLARTTWVDRGTFPLPLAVDPNGIIYEQEYGSLANGATRVGQVFAQSGPAEIGSGAQMIYSNLMLPDGYNLPSLEMTAKTRQTPSGPLSTGTAYPLVPNAEGYIPVRIAGRQVALRFDQTADTDWSLGKSRLKVTAGGGR
jgi:hypothetical protein